MQFFLLKALLGSIVMTMLREALNVAKAWNLGVAYTLAERWRCELIHEVSCHTLIWRVFTTKSLHELINHIRSLSVLSLILAINLFLKTSKFVKLVISCVVKACRIAEARHPIGFDVVMLLMAVTSVLSDLRVEGRVCNYFFVEDLLGWWHHCLPCVRILLRFFLFLVEIFPDLSELFLDPLLLKHVFLKPFHSCILFSVLSFRYLGEQFVLIIFLILLAFIEFVLGDVFKVIWWAHV